MRNSSWNDLLSMIGGKKLNYRPSGFIIDSPWLPGWCGITTLDYYASDEKWLKANIMAAQTFPDVWFMPGFWSEYGMCTEPSAFGSRLIFLENTLPHAEKISMILLMLTGFAAECKDRRTSALYDCQAEEQSVRDN